MAQAGVALGVITIVTGIVFLVDLILSLRYHCLHYHCNHRFPDTLPNSDIIFWPQAHENQHLDLNRTRSLRSLYIKVSYLSIVCESIINYC